MVLPLYLAMTAAEIQGRTALPERPAWMACHFSPYAKGISNAPASLPQGSMLILNDRIPPQGHDPGLVAAQLAEAASQVGAERLLLDFQRPGIGLLQEVAAAVAEKAACPVAVTPLYAGDLPCPVFLLPKLHKPLGEQLQAYPGREIWLEAALECQQVTVTEKGSQFTEIPLQEGNFPHADERLHCSYRTEVGADFVRFTLQRDRAQLQKLLEQAQTLGVACAVGLYQQLQEHIACHSEERSDVGIRSLTAKDTDCHASVFTGSQ